MWYNDEATMFSMNKVIHVFDKISSCYTRDISYGCLLICMHSVHTAPYPSNTDKKSIKRKVFCKKLKTFNLRIKSK